METEGRGRLGAALSSAAKEGEKLQLIIKLLKGDATVNVSHIDEQ